MIFVFCMLIFKPTFHSPLSACCCKVALVVSNSVRPHRQQPTRLPHPGDSPGKNTGVGCHFLLQCMKVKVKGKSFSHARLFSTPWTAAHQAPPSMGLYRQEYWSGLPLPSPKISDKNSQRGQIQIKEKQRNCSKI